MDNIVFVNKEFQLAVCKACESEVWGDIARHFADHHKATWKQHRKELKAHIRTMNLADRETVLANSPPPSKAREAIPGIAVLNGLCCEAVEDCSLLSISKKAMRRHCREDHRRTVEKGSTLWGECHIQSFFGTPYIR
jgi:Orsellinic acid/F9775 biosynthesis cluster protein D